MPAWMWWLGVASWTSPPTWALVSVVKTARVRMHLSSGHLPTRCVPSAARCRCMRAVGGIPIRAFSQVGLASTNWIQIEQCRARADPPALVHGVSRAWFFCFLMPGKVWRVLQCHQGTGSAWSWCAQFVLKRTRIGHHPASFQKKLCWLHCSPTGDTHPMHLVLEQQQNCGAVAQPCLPNTSAAGEGYFVHYSAYI